MKRVAQMLVLGLITVLVGCTKEPERQARRDLPDIMSESEEGFVDLVFAITDSKVGPDGSATVHAQGLHRGSEVGLRVVLVPTSKEGALVGDIPLFKCRVFYESTGEESDRLVQALGELYGTPIRPRSMRKGRIPFTGVTLSGNPNAPTSAPVQIKLFVESEDEEQYCELYTNLDLQKRRLEIREKDSGYRGPLMRAIGTE